MRTATRDLLAWVLVVKLVFVLLLLVAADHYPREAAYTAEREAGTPKAFWVLGRGWDSHAYQGLAADGYSADRFRRNYPLGYPLLIRAAATLTGSLQVAAVLVSNVAALAAVLAFLLLAQRLARQAGIEMRAVTPAVLMFAVMPGVLAFGTVAYSESTFVLVSLLAWLSYLRAGDGRVRALPWLLAASLLFGMATMVRHLGAAVFLGLALIEAHRVWRTREARGRALLEGLAALAAGPALVGYFLWKWQAHDLAGLQQDIWQMHFVPLGGLPSLVELGTAPEYIAAIAASLPLVGLLLLRLASVDKRLAVLCLCTAAVALSFTGTAAQSLTRYLWTLWPLPLGALVFPDRAVAWALVGWLFCLSAWAGIGHVLGTTAL